ncbi:MAG TPA: 16S rRNA (cytosine(1402)-N(4))-methyltransferase RsmH [Acidimicrobiales bacterium]|jgi:16S rRNA (cytosine1402-N4)-methyltransferase|nr:16S rRNA (cytosine(1402)-N(4))-methyltransferase RsmH [Acidimicrobiales bacterium]
MNREFRHDPVMLAEVVSTFDVVPAGTIIDATLGGGGHAAALLDRRPDIALVGIDRDRTAIDAASEQLARFGERFEVRRSRFDAMGAIASDIRARGRSISGVLFDLGVSSPQLDESERGFSFHHDGPLDMRMDPDSPLTAADIVNGSSEDELIDLLRESGEERLASRIVRAIVSARPISTTARLAEVVADAVPAASRRRGHPARRVFQGLRIAVNDELAQLPQSIDAAIDALVPHGRIVILSYHSGEDKIAKDRLRVAATGGCVCPPRLPCVCGATPTVRLIRGTKMPSAAEIARNPRAEAARFRAAEKLGPELEEAS